MKIYKKRYISLIKRLLFEIVTSRKRRNGVSRCIQKSKESFFVSIHDNLVSISQSSSLL